MGNPFVMQPFFHFFEDAKSIFGVLIDALNQRRTQRGAMGANAATRLSGPRRTSYLPMQSHRIEFSWYTYEATCGQLSFFEVSGAANQDAILSRGPLERTGVRTKGVLLETKGPLRPPYDGAP